MRRTITFAAVIMILALAVGFTGCTMHITMNPSSAAELASKHIPYKILLFMDGEFRNYHWQGFSSAELQGLDYNLGSASKNLFIDAFKRVSEGVTVVESRPIYPVAGHGDIVLVVHPRIGRFSEKHNPFIRNANYYAEITYQVTVYDKIGRIVLEKNYTAGGVEMGSMDVYRNHAAPAEKAMAQAIVMIIDDINKLAPHQNPDNKER
jgi:hypothetical protein